ncbi:MAG: DUF4845 domain-containing protein [Pseudomonadales bacterium]
MTMISRTQRGMGIWGYLWLLLLVASVATLVLRLGPHYLTNRTVHNVLEGIASEPIHKMDKRAIRDLLKKRFQINSLYDLEPKSVVDIERTKEWTKLIVNYEVREPIVYNVDAMLTFHDELQFQ